MRVLRLKFIFIFESYKNKIIKSDSGAFAKTQLLELYIKNIPVIYNIT